ncbi:class I SAM-dependent methyltransferase [Desulfonema magnum]|uniref:SAM-dependent methyltransferase n=1 Tax=Desulfonema magnum TaxID=45655 RepID=A0A975BKI1_9BACT|nr:class I SAM-dependent methyltransferase [Desulfonema magnum]QTA87083.1 SAM-dependent methyltransferase [Desulfonema magnum]
MSFSTFFSKQARKPSGIFGRFVASRIFDKKNVEMNDFIKELMTIQQHDHILEIGFGTGNLMNEIAELANQGIVQGIDFSDTMVSVAQKRNRKHIASGRVIIRQGDFDEIPYDHNKFDKICSTNTIYFWQDPEKTLQKILNLLKTGGKLMLGFHNKTHLEKMSLNWDVFRAYSQDDVKTLLINAGFTGGVDIMSRKGKEAVSYCAVAAK